jgi:hypothetical protein
VELDADKRRALSQFYREEFQRHIQQLECCGILNERNRDAVHGACRRFLDDLDRVCWRSDFPAMAETLLQNFEVLTRLSELEPPHRH